MIIFSSIILLILIYHLLHTQLYLLSIYSLISTSLQQNIKNKLLHSNHNTLTELSIIHHSKWQFIWIPLSIITIFSLTTFILSFQYTSLNIVPYPTITIPLLITSTITPKLLFNSPPWLNEWSSNITLATLILQLESINHDLSIIKQQIILKQYNNINELINHTNYLISLSQYTQTQISNITSKQS